VAAQCVKSLFSGDTGPVRFLPHLSLANGRRATRSGLEDPARRLLDGRRDRATEFTGNRKREEWARLADTRVMATDVRFPEGPVRWPMVSVILGEIAGSAVTRIAPDGGKSAIGSAGGGPNGLARGPDWCALWSAIMAAMNTPTAGFFRRGRPRIIKAAISSGSIPRTGGHAGSLQPVRGHKLSAPTTSSSTATAASISPISASAGTRPRPWRASIMRCPTAQRSSSWSIRC